MKKSIYTFGICLAIGLSSCSGSIEDAVGEMEEMADEAKEEMKAEPTIVGDWGLSDFDMGMEIPPAQAEMFDAMKKEMIANGTMSYKEDGTYIQNDMMNGQIVKKTGTYSVDGMKLTTTSEDGTSATIEMTSLTDTEMAFAIEDRGNTMTMTYARK